MTILLAWSAFLVGFLAGCVWAGVTSRNRCAECDARLLSYLTAHGVTLPL